MDYYYYDNTMIKEEKKRGNSYHEYNEYNEYSKYKNNYGKKREYSNKNKIVPKIKYSNRNIILERLIDDKSSSFLPEPIMDILRRGTARIEFDINKIGTSFFMKIEIKKKPYNFLLTCSHFITKEDIYSKKKIYVNYGKKNKEKKVEIILDKNKRFIKVYENLDVTLIELLKEDNIPEKCYLYPDLNYKNKGFFNYINIKVYTAGFPDVEIYEKDRQMSTGKIIEIKDSEFVHTCDTRKGSSGSPIVNYSGNVIGIHFGGDKEEGHNYGYFIGEIIDRIKKENIKNLENYSKNINVNNFNKAKNFVKNTIELFGPMIYDPKLLNYSKMFYQDPKNRELLKNVPIFKENPIAIEMIKDPNIFDYFMKKENIDNTLKKMGIEPPRDINEKIK